MIEIIPNAGELDRYAELAEKNSLGFEYNDFFIPDLLDDREALKQRIALYKGLGRPEGIDTLHGAFFDIVPFSWDSGIRRHSLYRMQQSVEIACELGCRGVVFHTGIAHGLVSDGKYRANWLEVMEKTMRRLLAESGQVEIYCENVFDEKSPFELRDLAFALRDEERFGVCLDVAHLMLSKEKPERWFRELAPYVRHFHLNDNHLERDEHLALGGGSIDWGFVFGLVRDNGLLGSSILLEMNGMEKIQKSLEFIEKYVGVSFKTEGRGYRNGYSADFGAGG